MPSRSFPASRSAAGERPRSTGLVRDAKRLPEEGVGYVGDTSIAFGQRRQKAGVRPSMGSLEDACDNRRSAVANAPCESLFGTLECELLDRISIRNFTHGRRENFEYIEGWYNPHRRHSALDYECPISYERRHQIAA